jgi:hypothetical protein
MKRTVFGGMAHAQSLHKLPFEQAFSISAEEHSVVPIHIMWESTSRVTCKASAGREGSDDAKYRASTDIVGVVIVEAAACRSNVILQQLILVQSRQFAVPILPGWRIRIQAIAGAPRCIYHRFLNYFMLLCTVLKPGWR